MFAELGALHAPLLRHLQDQGAAHKKTVAGVDRVVWHRFARGGDQAALDIYCLVRADSADKLTEASVRSTWGYSYFLVRSLLDAQSIGMIEMMAGKQSSLGTGHAQ